MAETPYTTLQKIRDNANHLAVISDSALTLIMEDAALEVSDLDVPDKYREKLTRYLTIHLATLKPQEVVKEKMDVLERTYKNGNGVGLHSTVYGEEYARMVEKYTASPKKSINLVVL